MADLDVTRWLDKIGVRPMMLLGSIIAGIALGVQIWLWVNNSDYQPLYTGLADREASQVSDALNAAGIPMRISNNGAIEIPAGRIREARLVMAGQSLPVGGSVGMEMLHQEQGFGTSQFIETARYQTALETELARTISAMQSVKVARVHLAMAKESAFARDHREASASVLVDIYPGRRLEMAQVDAIVHLVSGSVPNLPASAVTVVDQSGSLLSDNNRNPELAASAAQFEQRNKLESSYVRRIEQLLTPMLGVGRVSAQVAADMDFSITEEAREVYDADARVVRTEQVSENSSRGQSNVPGGVPGATANQPATAEAARNINGSSSADVKNLSRNESRQYEVDRTVSHTRTPSGVIKRLSVAVLIDHLPVRGENGEAQTQALTQEQLKQVEGLVKEAVGFSVERGDTVAITNQPFLRPEIEPLPGDPIWQQPWLHNAGKQILGVLVLLAIGFGVLRPAMKDVIRTQGQIIRNRAAGALPDDSEAGAQAMAVAGAMPAPSGPSGSGYQDKLAVARGAVTQDPKQVAQVVKSWVANDG